MANATVRIAVNFERNLEEIRQFLIERNAVTAFDSLLESLFEEIIPNLERFPEIGRNFLVHTPQSVEAEILQRRVQNLLQAGASLREYLRGDYLLLYTLRNKTIHLLSIKHHRQLSFDLKAHWLSQ